MSFLYNHVKSSEFENISICGISILYRDICNHRRDFFGGIIKTHKINQEHIGYIKKTVSVFNKTLYERVIENNYKTYYVFGKKVYSVSLCDILIRQYSGLFGEHDHIYVLRANAGEIYLVLVYILDFLIKRNQSKNPLLLASKKYHMDMIKMICPDINCVYVDKFETKIVLDEFDAGRYKITMLFQMMHFKQIEFDMLQNGCDSLHYFDAILKRFHMNREDVGFRKIIIEEEPEKTMLEKVGMIGLDINNFVFIAPEAQSCEMCPDGFWRGVVDKLKLDGVDVYVNLAKNSDMMALFDGCKTCDLSFQEAFALARLSKKIIALRSGFVEMLLQAGVEMEVIYTGFKKRQLFDSVESNAVLNTFALSKLPFIENFKLYEAML